MHHDSLDITQGAAGIATAPGHRTPRGMLRIAMADDLTVSVDATHKAYEVIVWGMGETLTRISPHGTLESWLAEGVRNIDPLTWRVSLRTHATFWDGTPVNAEAVAASFRMNWKVQPDVDSLISSQTHIAVIDDTTLEFRTPEPTGNFPNALSYHQFVVHKDGGTTMTGPYRPTRYEPEHSMTLEPFIAHWSGVPPIAHIVVNVVLHPQDRIAALRCGEADMVYGLPPQMRAELAAEFETTSVPSKKLHYIQFHHTHSPFNDRNLREATSLALDRGTLLADVMNGQGAVVSGMFPSGAGVEVPPKQSTDVARAAKLLDASGWTMGPDGVRSKGRIRLAFTLYSFPQRSEMTPLAHAIQRQLAPHGYDVTVQEVPNIVAQTKGGDFSAAMRSINSLVTGDPYFLIRAMLAKGGRANSGDYFNPEIERLIAQLRGEPDPSKRQTLSRQIQERAGSDVPNVYLFVTPIITAARKGVVRGYVPDGNSQYFITNALSVS